MPKKYPNLQERIIANSVLAPDSFYDGSPCWWWIGARGGNGRYGKISIRSTRVIEKRVKGKVKRIRKVKYKLVHRIARQVFKGEIFRRGKYGRHLCPPHPNRTLCCNPDHIASGTPKQNNRDTVRDGTHVPGTSNQYGEFNRRVA